MPEMTTATLIKALQEKDPTGDHIVFVDAEHGDGTDIEVMDAEEYGGDVEDNNIIIFVNG